MQHYRKHISQLPKMCFFLEILRFFLALWFLQKCLQYYLENSCFPLHKIRRWLLSSFNCNWTDNMFVCLKIKELCVQSGWRHLAAAWTPLNFHNEETDPGPGESEGSAFWARQTTSKLINSFSRSVSRVETNLINVIRTASLLPACS